MSDRWLVGRDPERECLARLIRGVTDRGGALALYGEAGIGKSVLLADAGATAAAAGMRVLSTVGVETEQHLPYAGLHQIMYPMRAAFDALPRSQRDAVRAAIQLTDQAVPDVHLVGLAVLNVLAKAAATAPLLLIADDAHWLDPASADVLAFVARRLASEPVILVAAIRDGAASRLGDAGLPSMTVARLSEHAAASLLDTVAPDLGPLVRQRLLEEAAGNPLALTELPKTVHMPGAAPLSTLMPLTARLERMFTAQVEQLPADTRTVLMIAALNDGAAVAEALAAAASITGSAVDGDVLLPAVDAQLIDVDANAVTFRHPLLRSAISQAASTTQRQRVHAALGEVLAGQADRRAWHRAAATTGPDETVAAELEAAANHARHRGGVGAAITAFEHAARLSAAPERRADRLLRAADLAVESGQRGVAERVLGEVATVHLTGQQRARFAWIQGGFDDGMREDLGGPSELADLAESVAAGGDADLAERILRSAAVRCFWVEPGAQARTRIQSVAEALFTDERNPRFLTIMAYAAPVERGTTVVDGLTHLAGRTTDGPLEERFLGAAALQVGMFDVAVRLSAASLPGLRAQGRLGLLTRALATQAWSAVRLGDLETAALAAEEGSRLAHETGQPLFLGIARASQAEVAALRGDYARSELLAAEAEQVSLSAGARPVLAVVQMARGLAALGDGRFTDAFAHLRRMHDPADPAFQVALRCYAISELAEAAVRSGRVDDMTDIMRELERLGPSTSSPALGIGLRYARAVLADDGDAEARFQEALKEDLCGWPLQRARLQLAYGVWLRRRRRATDSRPYLRTAREAFDALGMGPWGERAQIELRAAGEGNPTPAHNVRDRLTAQELHIARLAAEGLTNRQIGQRLHLSHRTISTHLYRMFPKLGITSRAELGTVVYHEDVRNVRGTALAVRGRVRAMADLGS